MFYCINSHKRMTNLFIYSDYSNRQFECQNYFLEYLVNLINLRSSWKQRLHCQQFCEYAPHRPQVDRSGVYLERCKYGNDLVCDAAKMMAFKRLCSYRDRKPTRICYSWQTLQRILYQKIRCQAIFINITFHKQN